MDSDSPRDLDSYLLSSTYRSNVLEHLATKGAATPTEISAATDDPRPHVSRALSELQDEGVVTLAVSEGRQVGRYYELTEQGASAWERIEPEIRNVSWTVVDPSSETDRELVVLAESRFGDDLRTAGRYADGTARFLYADPEVLAGYSEDELEEGIRTLAFEHSLSSVDFPTERCWADLVTFEGFTLLRVRTESRPTAFVSVDSESSISVPDFAESVADLLQSGSE